MIQSLDSIIRKAALKPAASPRNNTHSLELCWYEKVRACIVWLEKFGAQYCMGSKSSEFGITWARKARSLVLYRLEIQLNYFFYVYLLIL